MQLYRRLNLSLSALWFWVCSWLSLLWLLLRRLRKWVLRRTTRLCELQRICYGEEPGALRTLAVGEERV